MPFFEGSSNFKITGGTFNAISGDLNKHYTTHSTFTSNSYNNNPNGDPTGSHPYYHPYAPRGRAPPRRPQYPQREQGAFGYTEYHDDLPPQPGGQYQYGRYDGLGDRSRFESSLRSPAAHVEIVGGEFNAVRGESRATHDSQDHMSHTVPETTNTEENPGDRDTTDTTSESDMDDEPTTPTDASDAPVPAATDVPPSAAQKPSTLVENMRMSMAGLGIDETQGVDSPPSLVSQSSSETKQKSGKSLFPSILRRPKNTPN
ncbi:hypothetical protein B0H17DRAFT_1072004 [Mycena rosella]|uniref:Uncharacterized protein n=1 Tax=Mycena rosella TaxID=1033263 RepID=A0AAD7GBG4_MYCRO|nr:hypothetical protein B0H17DRAFT_1072004 [Mycena rosella]